MKKVIRIDADGFFLEDVILQNNENIPSDCIEIECKEGLYKPKWNGIEWIEGLTNEEIDTIKNTPQPKTELEIAQDSINSLGSQLVQAKISNMQKDSLIKSLGTQITQAKLEDLQNKTINNSLGKQLVQSKIQLMQLKGGN